MLRKYQTITIFALFACMLSFIVACSNDDVPVGEDEMEIPGASIGSRLVGMWVCTETDNESLIPVGFHFDVSQELVVKPDRDSPLIHYGYVQVNKRVTFGDGPALSINNLIDGELSLAYTSDTTYIFSFVRIY